MTSARCRFEELCCCRNDRWSKDPYRVGALLLVTAMKPLSLILALKAILLGFKIEVLYQTFWRCLFNTE